MFEGMTEQRRRRAITAHADGSVIGPAIAAAAFVLVLGTFVYLLDRPLGSVPFFAGISLADTLPISLGTLGSIFPSFAHTFAFAAMTAALMSRQRDVGLACLAWLGVELAFEVGQLPTVASALAARVPSGHASLPVLSDALGYFANGTFDPWDLISAGLGALAAYGFVTVSARRSVHGE